jgi:hypothetical protein
MEKRDSPELIEEKKAVAEIYSSNRLHTSELQIQYRELTGRARAQTSLWETETRNAHDREPEYATQLDTVSSIDKEIVRLLTEKVDENKRMQQLRSETSDRDQVAMLSLYKKLRENGVREGAVDLPHLQGLIGEFDEAVTKLQDLVADVMKERDR